MLKKFIFFAFVLFMLALSAVSYFNRHTHFDKIAFPIPDEYMPGSLTTLNGYCDWASLSYDHEEVYCQRDKYSFGYDIYSHKIISSTMAVDYKLGELIDAWGTPTGEHSVGDFMYVYWNNSYVYIQHSNISPNSKVYFVGANSEPGKDVTAWRGFSIY